MILGITDLTPTASFRLTHLAIFIFTTALVLIAIYVEPFASLEPCPMCMMQRLVFVLIAGVAFLAALHNPTSAARHLYSSSVALLTLIGGAIASRQIWLQHLPEDRVPACGPGLDYMLDVFPLLEVIEMALVGTGDCAKVDWSFMGISIAGYSLLAFIAILLAALSLFRNKNTIKLNN